MYLKRCGSLIWANSSAGQSTRLIIVRSVVRVHFGPPTFHKSEKLKCTLKTEQYYQNCERDIRVKTHRFLLKGKKTTILPIKNMINKTILMITNLQREPIRNIRSSYKGRRANALASGAEERRGKLRKATGSRKQTLYPQISEWSNPHGVMSMHHILNTQVYEGNRLN